MRSGFNTVSAIGQFFLVVLVYGVCEKYQANLQLYNNVETLVIIGPITDPRNISNKRTVDIRQDQVTPIPFTGCPVICHGLVSKPHLNGELGDVTNYRHIGSEFQIKALFEKQSLKSVRVYRENL